MCRERLLATAGGVKKDAYDSQAAWVTSFALVAATCRCTRVDRLSDERAIRIRLGALRLARLVAGTCFHAIDELQALGVADAVFELHFAFLCEAKVARFYLIGPGTRRQAERSRTTRGKREFGVTRSILFITGGRATGHHGRAFLNALNEPQTRRFVGAFAIRRVALVEQAITASVSRFGACRSSA